MPVIGVIDDRQDVRKILSDSISLTLPTGWEVIDIPPWSSLNIYPSWISENEIVALIIDEQLNEATDKSDAVNYQGHDLVDYLRQYLKELPIFVVTSHLMDSDFHDELQERFKYVEDMIERNQFYERPSDYVERMTRAGQRYLQTFEQELADLAEFAKKAAIGEDVSPEEQKRAIAIQTKIETAFPIENIANRSEWLLQMQHLIEELETLKIDIEQRLQR